jgi:outer membrane protein assembly factor BamA
VEHLQPTVGVGSDSSVPSIEALFNDATAPGLSSQPDYLRSSAFVEIDYRQPLNARRGGWYRFEFSRYADRDLGAYSFDRLDVDLRQYVPFLAERRILAGRAFVSTSEAGAGQTIPFYLMPYLGGSDTLRGFREYRFRGPHLLLLQAEYRYEIWSALDGAFFYDAGKVALDRADLDFTNLETDYGFGFRFNTDNGVVMRVDAGFGSPDGKHLYITFGGVF